MWCFGLQLWIYKPIYCVTDDTLNGAEVAVDEDITMAKKPILGKKARTASSRLVIAEVFWTVLMRQKTRCSTSSTSNPYQHLTYLTLSLTHQKSMINPKVPPTPHLITSSVPVVVVVVVPPSLPPVSGTPSPHGEHCPASHVHPDVQLLL